MRIIRSLAGKHPTLFALISTGTWFGLLVSLTGIASGALGMPVFDEMSIMAGRLGVSLCFLFILWKLGWLRSAGVAHPGSPQVWLIALAGMLYLCATSLSIFFGRLTFDLPNPDHLPDALAVLTNNLAIVLCEEIPFRGLILHALVRARGATRAGLIGSALLSSLLFAVLHIIQVFTFQISLPSALLLIAETFIISIWWSALVISGKSIWPGAMVHFMFNTVVALQALSTPVLDAGPRAYANILLFNLPLGMLGIWMLLRARLVPPEVEEVKTSKFTAYEEEKKHRGFRNL